MSNKKQKPTDQARFEGNGISYRAKIIGIEDVAEARGDQMCQEAMLKLKEQVKTSGQHKQRIFVNVTLEGLRIVDAVSTSILHTHQVHQISFISRDVTDTRAFGYIASAGDGTHKFFAIKTANAAENLVLCLRDLFQTVYELKKKEMEDAKAKAAEGAQSQGEGETTAQQQTAASEQTAEGQESIYQVPKSNAPVNPKEQNLLDLEDQVDTILKGIEQIKNLDFDELTSEEAPRQPTSSAPSLSSPPSTPATLTTPAANDPWGVPPSPASPPTSPPPSSALSGLQLSSPPPMGTPAPFGGMHTFPGTPAPSVGVTAPGFGMVHPGAMPYGVPPQQMAAMAGTPYGAAYVQQPGMGGVPFAGGAMRGAVPAQPGFPGMAAPGAPFNPFGMGMVPPPQMAPQGADPFQNPPENLLQPLRPGGDQGQGASPKSPTREALFGDLVDIKKSPGVDAAAKSPKELFRELSQPPKKTLNEMKSPKSPS